MKQHREASLGARPVLHQVVDGMVTTGNRREHIEVDGSREYSCNGKAPHRLEYERGEKETMVARQNRTGSLLLVPPAAGMYARVT